MNIRSEDNSVGTSMDFGSDHKAPRRPPWPYHTFVLMTTLYMIQGIPLGLIMGSLNYLLKSSPAVSYSMLGVFAIAGYPYSLKLLWSPIVDGVFNDSFGRRKTWIVPMQTITGTLLFFLSSYIDDELASESPRVVLMTAVCFLTVLASATQDIALDGWCVSALPEYFRSYASTIQTVGLQLGFFSSFTLLLAVQSAEFSNRFRSLPLDTPLVTVGEYMRFWSYVYFLVNFYLIFFAHEKPYAHHRSKVHIFQVVRRIRAVISLRPMKQLIVVLVTMKVGFVVFDSVTALKLMDAGFEKHELAVFAIVDFPLQIAIALFVGTHTSRSTGTGETLTLLANAYLCRVVLGALGAALVYLYPGGRPDSFWFYLTMLGSSVYSASASCMFVAQGAFFAKIVDVDIGGSYLTILNTMANLGGTWPKSLVLWLVDALSSWRCELPVAASGENHQRSMMCSGTIDDQKACEALGGKCLIVRDGYYAVALLSTLYGLAYFFYGMRKYFQPLQYVQPAEWHALPPEHNDDDECDDDV